MGRVGQVPYFKRFIAFSMLCLWGPWVRAQNLEEIQPPTAKAQHPLIELRMIDFSSDSLLMSAPRIIEGVGLGSLQGDYKNPQFLFQISAWGFEHNYLVLKNFTLNFRASEWSLKRSSFLELKCLNPVATWQLGDVAISPDLLRELNFSMIKNAEQKSVLQLGGNLERVLQQVLAPHFREAALQRDLRLRAECPSNMSEVLEGFVRAWLVDYPVKNPKSFKSLVAGIRSESLLLGDPIGLNVFQNKVAAIFDKQPQIKSIVLKAERSASSRVLRFVPLIDDSLWSVEETLSQSARQLLVDGAAPSGIEILGNSSALDAAAEEGMSQLPVFKVRSTNGASFFDVDYDLQVESFVSVLPELHPYKGLAMKMHPRVIFEDCAEAARFPRFIPYVSFDGFSHLELDWMANLELVESLTEKVLSKRALSPFGLRTLLRNDPAGFIQSDFEGGGVLDGAVDNGRQPGQCQVQSSPAEFAITLDWLLKSEGLKNALQRALFKPFNIASQHQTSRLRLLGEALPEQKHADLGYKAEAWVLQIK